MSNDNPQPQESGNNTIIIWMVVLCCAVFVFLKFSMHSTMSAGDSLFYQFTGVRYYNGIGVKQDLKTAADMFEKAAQLGNTHSQYILGHMYEKGQGRDVNLVKAISFYKIAGQKGHLKAQEALGRLYLDGPDSIKDLEQAYMWLYIAVEQGSYESLSRKLQVIDSLPEEKRIEAREKAKKFIEVYIKPNSQDLKSKGMTTVKGLAEKVNQ